MNKHIGCGYLYGVILREGWLETVERIVNGIIKANLTFDSIAFTGMSGALIAPAIAARLGKEMLMVRKPDTVSHSGHRVEGNGDAKTYIVVDDLISSGNTANHILDTITSKLPDAKCVAFVLYCKTERYYSKFYRAIPCFNV